MHKRLICMLLVCGVQTLHTASQQDLIDFKSAVLKWKTNKSPANVDAILDSWETLQADSARPQWAQQARIFAQKNNVDIDTLTATEAAPEAVTKQAAPRIIAPQPIRPVAPPPVPRPITPRRPLTTTPTSPAVAAPAPACPAPVRAPVRPVALPIATVLEPEEETGEEFVSFTRPARSITEEEMARKYEGEEEEEEGEEPAARVRFAEKPEVFTYEPGEAIEPEAVTLEDITLPISRGKLEVIKEEEEPLSSTSPAFENAPHVYETEAYLRPYSEEVNNKLNRMRGWVKFIQSNKRVGDDVLEGHLEALEKTFREISPELNAFDFENLQQDIGDLRVLLEQRKLSKLLKNLEGIYQFIQSERRKGRQPNQHNVHNFITQYEQAQRSWVAPAHKKEQAIYQKLNKEFAQLYEELQKGLPLSTMEKPPRSSFFPFMRTKTAPQPAVTQSPEDAQLTDVANTIHNIRENIATLKDTPELLPKIKEQAKIFNQIRNKFPVDDARIVQLVDDLRYMNTYLNEGKKAADTSAAETKALDKNLRKLIELEVKFGEQEKQNKPRTAKDEKEFIDLYEQADAALAEGVIPSSRAEWWENEMHRGGLFANYRILTGQGALTTASASLV